MGHGSLGSRTSMFFIFIFLHQARPDQIRQDKTKFLRPEPRPSGSQALVSLNQLNGRPGAVRIPKKAPGGGERRASQHERNGVECEASIRNEIGQFRSPFSARMGR